MLKDNIMYGFILKVIFVFFVLDSMSLSALAPDSALTLVQKNFKRQESQSKKEVIIKKIKRENYPTREQLLEGSYVAGLVELGGFEPVMRTGMVGRSYVLSAPIERSIEVNRPKTPVSMQVDFDRQYQAWFVFDRDVIPGKIESVREPGIGNAYQVSGAYKGVSQEECVSFTKGLKAIIIRNYSDYTDTQTAIESPYEQFQQLQTDILQGKFVVPDGVKLIFGNMQEGKLNIRKMVEVSNPSEVIRQVQQLNTHPEEVTQFLLKKTTTLSDEKMQEVQKNVSQKIEMFTKLFKNEVPISYQDMFHLILIIQEIMKEDPKVLESPVWGQILSFYQKNWVGFLLKSQLFERYKQGKLTKDQVQDQIDFLAKEHMMHPSLVLKLISVFDQINHSDQINQEKKTKDALYEYKEGEMQRKMEELTEKINRKWNVFQEKKGYLKDGVLFQKAEYGFLDRMVICPQGYPLINPNVPEKYNNRLVITQEELDNDKDLQGYRNYVKSLMEQLEYTKVQGYEANSATTAGFLGEGIMYRNLIDPITGRRIFFLSGKDELGQWIVDQEERDYFKGTCVEVTDYTRNLQFMNERVYMLTDEKTSTRLKKLMFAARGFIGNSEEGQEDVKIGGMDPQKIDALYSYISIKSLLEKRQGKEESYPYKLMLRREFEEDIMMKYILELEHLPAKKANQGLLKQYIDMLSVEEKRKFIDYYYKVYVYQSRDMKKATEYEGMPLRIGVPMLMHLGKDLIDYWAENNVTPQWFQQQGIDIKLEKEKLASIRNDYRQTMIHYLLNKELFLKLWEGSSEEQKEGFKKYMQTCFFELEEISDDELLEKQIEISSQYSEWLKEAEVKQDKIVNETVEIKQEKLNIQPSTLVVSQMPFSGFILNYLSDKGEEKDQERLTKNISQTIENLVENQLSGSIWRPLVELINNGIDHSQSNVAVEVGQENGFITISVKDTGNGMTGNQIKDYLLNPYQSSNNFLERGQQDARTTGRFGMGFFSHLALIKADKSGQSYSQVITQAKGTSQVHEIQLKSSQDNYLDVQVNPDYQEKKQERESETEVKEEQQEGESETEVKEEQEEIEKSGTEVKLFLKTTKEGNREVFSGKTLDEVVQEIQKDLIKYLAFRGGVGVSLNGQRINTYAQTLNKVELKSGEESRWGILNSYRNIYGNEGHNEQSTLTFLVNGTAITSEKLSGMGSWHMVIDLPSQFPLSSDRETIGSNSQEEKAYLQEIGMKIFDQLLKARNWDGINLLYKKWEEWGLYTYVISKIQDYLDNHTERIPRAIFDFKESRYNAHLHVNLIPMKYVSTVSDGQGIVFDTLGAKREKNKEENKHLLSQKRKVSEKKTGVTNYRIAYQKEHKGNTELDTETTPEGVFFMESHDEAMVISEWITEESFESLFKGVEWLPHNIYALIKTLRRIHDKQSGKSAYMNLIEFCPLSSLESNVRNYISRYQDLNQEEESIDVVSEMEEEWIEIKETFFELLSQDTQRLAQKKKNEQSFQVKDILVSVNQRNELFYLNNGHKVSLEEKKKRVQKKVDLIKTILDVEEEQSFEGLTPSAYALKMNLITIVSQWILMTNNNYSEGEVKQIIRWVHQTAETYQDGKEFTDRISEALEVICVGYLLNQQKEGENWKETWFEYLETSSRGLGYLRKDVFSIGNELFSLLLKKDMESHKIQENVEETLPEQKKLLWNSSEYTKNFYNKENAKRALTIASNQNTNKFFEIKERVVNSVQANASEVRIAVQKVEGKDEIVLLIDDNGDGVPAKHIMAFIVPDYSYGEGKVEQGKQRNFGRGSKAMWGEKGRNLWVWSRSKKTGKESLRVFSRPQSDQDFSVYMHQPKGNKIPFVNQPFFEGKKTHGTRVATNYKKKPEEVSFMMGQLEKDLSVYPFETFYLNGNQIEKKVPLFQNNDLAVVFSPEKLKVFDSTALDVHSILPSQFIQEEHTQFRVMRRHEAQNVTRTKIISLELQAEEKREIAKKFLLLQQTLSKRHQGEMNRGISHREMMPFIREELKKNGYKANLWKLKEDFMKSLRPGEKQVLEKRYLDFIRGNEVERPLDYKKYVDSGSEAVERAEECHKFLKLLYEYQGELGLEGEVRTVECKKDFEQRIARILTHYLEHPNVKNDFGHYAVFRYLESYLNYEHKQKLDTTLHIKECSSVDKQTIFKSAMEILDDVASEECQESRLLHFISVYDTILKGHHQFEYLKKELISYYARKGVKISGYEENEIKKELSDEQLKEDIIEQFELMIGQFGDYGSIIAQYLKGAEGADNQIVDYLLKIKNTGEKADPAFELFWNFLPSRKKGKTEIKKAFPFKYRSQLKAEKEKENQTDHHLLFEPADYMMRPRMIRKNMPTVIYTEIETQKEVKKSKIRLFKIFKRGMQLQKMITANYKLKRSA